MPKNQIVAFIDTIKTGNTVDLTLYKDPRFCKILQIYASKKIQALLAGLSEIHLHCETRKEQFYLSSVINNSDANGFTMLDYCIISGLDQFSKLFAVLGCNLHNNVEKLYGSLQEYYDIENAPAIMFRIREAYSDIEQGKLQNLQTPLIQSKIANAGIYNLNNFKIFCKNYRISMIFILIGISCLFLTPITLDASSTVGTVILFSVGIPALYAGLSNCQNATATKRSYDQASNNSRSTEEAKIIRTALELVNTYIFEQEQGHCVAHNIISTQEVMSMTDNGTMIRFRSKSDISETLPKVKLKSLVRSNSW